MARGDIQIDLETNDLKIEKTNSNSYVSASWEYISALNYVEVTAIIPQQYVDGFNSSLDWRTLVAPVRSLTPIDETYNDVEVRFSFKYLDFNGLTVDIATFQLANESSDDTIEYLYGQQYNELLNKEGDEEFVFNYRKDSVTNHEYFLMTVLVLGDFVVENNLNQNEYILLNANEGSFLQNPTFGVNASSYIQSPSSNETFLQTIVDKFAQDALRVLGIQKSEDVIEIQSEDYNKG